MCALLRNSTVLFEIKITEIYVISFPTGLQEILLSNVHLMADFQVILHSPRSTKYTSGQKEAKIFKLSYLVLSVIKINLYLLTLMYFFRSLPLFC